MKKSTRKTINFLTKYIGYEIIRTKPPAGWCYNWNYTDTPILLLGFTSDGRIRYRRTDYPFLYGDQEFTLPPVFTDRNYITYKKALRAKGNELNKWKGKKIQRIRPTAVLGSRMYMWEFAPLVWESAPTLVSASKHHMVIEFDYMGKAKIKVLNSDYINPEDWVLAE